MLPNSTVQKLLFLFSTQTHIALQNSRRVEKHEGVAVRSDLKIFTDKDRITMSWFRYPKVRCQNLSPQKYLYLLSRNIWPFPEWIWFQGGSDEQSTAYSSPLTLKGDTINLFRLKHLSTRDLIAGKFLTDKNTLLPLKNV